MWLNLASDHSADCTGCRRDQRLVGLSRGSDDVV